MSTQTNRSSRIFSASTPMSFPRPPPREVFPEQPLSPGGLQATTVFWESGIRFHQYAHCCWMVGGRVEVFESRATHVSAKNNAPPTAYYWNHIPSSRRTQPPSQSTQPSTQPNGNYTRGHTHTQSSSSHSSAYASTSSHPAPPRDYFSHQAAPSRPERASVYSAAWAQPGGAQTTAPSAHRHSRSQFEPGDGQNGYYPPNGPVAPQGGSGPQYQQPRQLVAPQAPRHVQGGWPDASGTAGVVEAYGHYLGQQQATMRQSSRSRERRQ